MDIRILYYFPFYCVGLHLDVSIIQQKKINAVWVAALALVLMLEAVYLQMAGIVSQGSISGGTMKRVVLTIAACGCGVPLMLFFSEMMERVVKIIRADKIVCALGYAGFMAYMMHRIIFQAVWSLTGIVSPILFAAECVLLIVGSWYLQKVYDIIVARIEKHGRKERI